MAKVIDENRRLMQIVISFYLPFYRTLNPWHKTFLCLPKRVEHQGFEIQTLPDFWMIENKIGLQMIGILNGIWILKVQPFENWTKLLPCCNYHFKSGLFRQDFESSGIQMVCAIWIPSFKKSIFQMFSDFEWSDFSSPLYTKNYQKYADSLTNVNFKQKNA